MSEEFCVGVKLLLARMKSHPEEFHIDNRRWGELVSEVFHVLDHQAANKSVGVRRWFTRALSDEEINALHKALIEAGRPVFDALVMEKLLANDPQMDMFEGNQARLSYPITDSQQKLKDAVAYGTSIAAGYK